MSDLLWRDTECNGAEINLFVGFNTGKDDKQAWNHRRVLEIWSKCWVHFCVFQSCHLAPLLPPVIVGPVWRWWPSRIPEPPVTFKTNISLIVTNCTVSSIALIRPCISQLTNSQYKITSYLLDTEWRLKIFAKFSPFYSLLSDAIFVTVHPDSTWWNPIPIKLIKLNALHQE